MIHPPTLQDEVRRTFRSLLNRVGTIIGGWGIGPNAITIGGFVVVTGAALAIPLNIQLAAWILLLSLPLDALDGAVARATGQVTPFGGILDSFFDRLADGLLFLGIAHYFSARGEPLFQVVAEGALIFSFGVSYLRARAGQARLDVRVGMMDRMVRVVLILVGLFIPIILPAVISIIAVGSLVTCFQRLFFIVEHAHEAAGKE